MYVILSYDVNQKRVGKVMKTCRKYMTHVQKSVFEGILTEGRLNSLKKELNAILDYETDGVRIYRAEVAKVIVKEEIGKTQEYGAVI